MKIIAIGDVHGFPKWKKIFENNTFDKFVFIGDYFDSRAGISAKDQIDNFIKIIEIKKQNIDKVVCLIGNHDYHYMKNVYETYSGFQAANAADITAVIQSALDSDLLQMCYKHDDKYIFSHAGITKTWCKNNDVDMTNIEQSINDLFKTTPSAFRFAMGDNFSSTGDDITQSPIWVRPRSLVKDRIDMVHIVGHTSVREIVPHEEFGLILIDSLANDEFISIEDGVVTVLKIK